LSNLSITTRHKDSLIGHKIEYNNSGTIKNKKQVARSIGTSVLLEKLFFSLPVRYKEFQRNLKKEYNKMLNVIQSYCLISDSIKLSCYHINGTKSTNLMNTNSRNTLKDNLIEIFGIQAFNSMIKFEQVDPSDETKDEFKVKNDESLGNLFKLNGYISNCSHGVGRSAPDRQYFYINKRPCDNSRVAKIINETFHEFNRTQYPMFVLNVNLDSRNVDVNVTPDKLIMFIKNENILCAILKESLRKMYSQSFVSLKYDDTSFSNHRKSKNAVSIEEKSFISKLIDEPSKKFNSTALNQIENEDEPALMVEKSTKKRVIVSSNSESDNEVEVVKNACPKPPAKQSKMDSTQPKILDFTVKKFSPVKTSTYKETESIVNVLFQNNIGTKQNLRSGAKINDSLCVRLETHCSGLNKSTIDKEDEKENSSPEKSPINKRKVDMVRKKMSKKTDHDLDVYQNSFEDQENNVSTQSLSSSNDESNNLDEPDEREEEEISTQTQITSTLDTTKAYIYFASKRYSKNLNFSFNELKRKLKSAQDINSKQNDEQLSDIKFKPKNLTRKDAESELDRFIKKENFLDMCVLGQFNKGFIIAQLNQDLFIIDQHAADEIYNFEMLQRNQKIQVKLALNTWESIY
jgi:DNA mismatch repair protein PMS2